MKRGILLLLIVLTFLFLNSFVCASKNWTLSYDSNETAIWSIKEYNNKLYAGSGSHGIIYEFNGTDWIINYNSPEGYIYSFEIYNNKLYAGTGNNGLIYEYDGATWSSVFDTNDTYIYGLYVYNNKLYAGTGLSGWIYEFNGTDWNLSYDTGQIAVNSFINYSNDLYAGTDGLGEIYLFNGTDWNFSYAIPEKAIYDFEILNNKLYAGTGRYGKVYEFNNTDWNENFTGLGLYSYVYDMQVYNNELYIGVSRPLSYSKIYVFDGSNWQETWNSTEKDILSFGNYLNNLYAGTDDNGLIFVYSEISNQLPLIISVSYIPSTIVKPNETLTMVINAVDPENDTIGYAHKCSASESMTSFNITKTRKCIYESEGNYVNTIFVNDTNHTDWNSFSYDILVTSANYTQADGGMPLPTELVEIDNINQGLMPTIFFSTLGFLSAIGVPVIIFIFTTFGFLAIIYIGIIFFKVVGKAFKG